MWTDADDGQIANLIVCSKPTDILVIPGVPVEKVYCDKAIAGLDLADELPFGTDIGT
jgi:hypothetical protein